jgi:hypothetical protein
VTNGSNRKAWKEESFFPHTDSTTTHNMDQTKQVSSVKSNVVSSHRQYKNNFIFLD